MRQSLLLAIATTCLTACSAATGDERVDFSRDIQPLLAQHCTSCHGGVKRAGGLVLLSGGRFPGSGDSGLPSIVPGKPDESEFFRRLIAQDADERMPAKGPPLPAEKIAIVRRWIEQGAAWPSHWSLTSLGQPDIPTVTDAAWTQTPIDRFVLARLEVNRLEPSPEANRYTLIRRLWLDLAGLAPSPADADHFSAAVTPDAYERLVDRLLASPHFGERWGRHWLDLARYADSDGYEVDKPRPDAYRWRDWVIEAVNLDVRLDDFTVRQFAGDLLPDADPMSRLATAYHRQTLTNNEGGVDKEEYRLKAVLDRVSNTGTVWLGLTLACAQCHDHPYDPFTQRNFYALAAIFNNADEAELELPEFGSGRRALRFRVLQERDAPRTTRLLKRGEFLQPGDEVSPALPTTLTSDTVSDSHSAIRAPNSALPPTRLDLAHWLVDRANPLTPRVAANQVWLKLFGQGLVRTPEDFGTRGERPTHPELLDWLARELIDRGYSRKAFIRQIVTSATYRQESRIRSDLESLDPANMLLARQNRPRVEAEIVRDLQLSAGGLLSTKIGGPSVFPPLGDEFVKITFRSELPWKTSGGEDQHRRGMYTFYKRSVPYPDLMAFDCPDASVAAAQRAASNTPLQALTLMNSETSLDAARGLAQQLLAGTSASDDELIRAAFRACLTRPPSPTEHRRLLKLFTNHRAWYESHPEDADRLTENLPHRSTSVPHVAALVATANALMNLDEFITRD